MTAYFLESSAAAKIYVSEVGSNWMTEVIGRDPANQLFVTRITPIEIASVIFRRVRSGRLPGSEAAIAIESLRQDVAEIFQIVEVSPELSDLALDVAERFALRGYDCVQLAASLLTQRYREAAGQSSMTFVSADLELNSAAESEGMIVENPNDHA